MLIAIIIYFRELPLANQQQRLTVVSSNTSISENFSLLLEYI